VAPRDRGERGRRPRVVSGRGGAKPGPGWRRDQSAVCTRVLVTSTPSAAARSVGSRISRR